MEKRLEKINCERRKLLKQREKKRKKPKKTSIKLKKKRKKQFKSNRMTSLFKIKRQKNLNLKNTQSLKKKTLDNKNSLIPKLASKNNLKIKLPKKAKKRFQSLRVEKKNLIKSKSIVSNKSTNNLDDQEILYKNLTSIPNIEINLVNSLSAGSNYIKNKKKNYRNILLEKKSLFKKNKKKIHDYNKTDITNLKKNKLSKGYTKVYKESSFSNLNNKRTFAKSYSKNKEKIDWKLKNEKSDSKLNKEKSNSKLNKDKNNSKKENRNPKLDNKKKNSKLNKQIKNIKLTTKKNNYKLKTKNQNTKLELENLKIITKVSNFKIKKKSLSRNKNDFKKEFNIIPNHWNESLKKIIEEKKKNRMKLLGIKYLKNNGRLKSSCSKKKKIIIEKKNRYENYLKKNKIFTQSQNNPLILLKNVLNKSPIIFKKEIFEKINKVNFAYKLKNDYKSKKYIDLIQIKLKILEKLNCQ